MHRTHLAKRSTFPLAWLCSQDPMQNPNKAGCLVWPNFPKAWTNSLSYHRIAKQGQKLRLERGHQALRRVQRHLKWKARSQGLELQDAHGEKSELPESEPGMPVENRPRNVWPQELRAACPVLGFQSNLSNSKAQRSFPWPPDLK